MGRPSEFTQEVADQICSRLADGESLRSVCRDEAMPCKAVVFKWMRVIPGFVDQYARAKEESADALSDEMLDIADDGRNDWMKRNAEDDAGWQANGENVQRSRVRIDTRKWLASKLKPKKYGDKIDMTHAGPDGGPIQNVTRIELVDLDQRPSKDPA